MFADFKSGLNYNYNNNDNNNKELSEWYSSGTGVNLMECFTQNYQCNVLDKYSILFS